MSLLEDKEKEIAFYRFARIANIPYGTFRRMMMARLEIGQYRYPDRRSPWNGKLSYGYAASVEKRLQWDSHEKYVDIANLAFLYFLRQCRFYYEERWAGIVGSFKKQNGYHSVRTARRCYELCDTKKAVTIHEHSARAERRG